MWPESLRRLHYIRTGRVPSPTNCEIASGLMDNGSVLDEHIHKLRGSREIRLVGTDDVTARIPIRWVVKDLFVEVRR